MSDCPACGAPLTLRPDTEGFQCSFCHQVFFPGQDDDGVEVSVDESNADINCPICFQPLVKASLAKAGVLYCVQCHGLLMPMEMVSGLVNDLRENLDRSSVQTPADHDELKRTIQCPKCNLRMDAHRYAGPGNVVVDNCDGCSLIWFDRGEVTRIARAPDNEDFDRSYGFN
jgi:Zn-finger nucleic acid-binding protein